MNGKISTVQLRKTILDELPEEHAQGEYNREDVKVLMSDISARLSETLDMDIDVEAQNIVWADAVAAGWTREKMHRVETTTVLMERTGATFGDAREAIARAVCWAWQQHAIYALSVLAAANARVNARGRRYIDACGITDVLCNLEAASENPPF